jgi:hypothetical protein
MDNEPQRQSPKPNFQPSSRPPYPDAEPASSPQAQPENDMWQSPRPATTELPAEEDRQFIPPNAAMPPQKKSKKKLVAIIIAVVVVLLGAGAALAYNFWFQNPDRVVTDGVMNALRAKTMTFEGVYEGGGETKGRLTLNGKLSDKGTGSVDASLKFSSKDPTTTTEISIDGAGVLDDKGDLYLKVKNFDDVINQQIGTDETSPERKKVLDDFTAKINDKWIKLSSDGLRQFSEGMAKSQKCLQDSVKKIQEDNKLSSELVSLYEKHRFVTVKEKLGSKDGSLGYLLESNNAAAKEFAKGFKETQAYKDMHACDESFTVDENTFTTEANNDEETRAELWIERWSHQITKFSVDSTNKKTSEKNTFILEPVFNQPVTIETPKDAMSTEELETIFNEFQTGLIGQMEAEAMMMEAEDSPLNTPSV